MTQFETVNSDGSIEPIEGADVDLGTYFDALGKKADVEVDDTLADEEEPVEQVKIW